MNYRCNEANFRVRSFLPFTAEYCNFNYYSEYKTQNRKLETRSSLGKEQTECQEYQQTSVDKLQIRKQFLNWP